jgi:hypothetical protein
MGSAEVGDRVSNDACPLLFGLELTVNVVGGKIDVIGRIIGRHANLHPALVCDGCDAGKHGLRGINILSQTGQ